MWWLLACDPTVEPEPEPVDLVAAYEARGLQGAGYAEGEVVYDHPATGSRTLRLAVWYPSPVVEGDDLEKYQGLFAADQVLDEPPIADGTFPTLVFSHGHQGSAENFGVVASFMASRGWIVLAPDHTDNTTFDGSDRETPIYFQRPADIQAVMDAALAGDVDPVADHLDGSFVGLGHSFGAFSMLLLAGATLRVDELDAACNGEGGYTICNGWSADWLPTLRAGFFEPRLSGVVLAAPGDWNLMLAEGIAAVQRPVLLASGQLDFDKVEENNLLWDALPAPAWRTDMAHGGHMAWSDFAAFPSIDTSPDVLPAERSLRIARVQTAAFSDMVLGVAPQAVGLFDGELLVDEDITASARP